VLDLDVSNNETVSSTFNNAIFANQPNDKTDLYYGVSWNYDLSDIIQLQLRYDDFDVDAFSFGVQYRFGR